MAKGQSRRQHRPLAPLGGRVKLRLMLRFESSPHQSRTNCTLMRVCLRKPSHPSGKRIALVYSRPRLEFLPWRTSKAPPEAQFDAPREVSTCMACACFIKLFVCKKRLGGLAESFCFLIIAKSLNYRAIAANEARCSICVCAGQSLWLRDPPELQSATLPEQMSP